MATLFKQDIVISVQDNVALRMGLLTQMLILCGCVGGWVCYVKLMLVTSPCTEVCMLTRSPRLRGLDNCVLDLSATQPTYIHLYLSSSIYSYVYRSIYVYIYLYNYLFIYQYLDIFFYLSNCISFCLSIFIYLSFCLSVYLSPFLVP